MSYDQLFSVQISKDMGKNWTELAYYNWNDAHTDWTGQALSLDGYQGKEIQIRFVAQQLIYYGVWKIDDVEISAATSLVDLDTGASTRASGNGLILGLLDPFSFNTRSTDLIPIAYRPAQNRTGEFASVEETTTQVITITYSYDPLNRLTAAVYSDDQSYQFVYDPVGNRVEQTTPAGMTGYYYDDANRLMNDDDENYTWDDNGNLLDDEVHFYTYDHANRLVDVSVLESTTTFGYNGLGDRLEMTTNGITTTHYTLDLVASLTQVLDDGEFTYLYGNGRIAQYDAKSPQYFLGDALGSVRQVVDANGEVLLARSYEPYGEVLASAGDGDSSYGFTGEMQDSYIKLIYLRSRMYSPVAGRFLTKDSWQGNYTRPLSLNGWNYVESNPINRTDPSGHSPLLCGVPFIDCVDTAKNAVLAAKAAYSKVGPTLLALIQREPWNNRFNCLDPRWSKPERAIDLLGDYFCERGPTSIVFFGDDTLTIELARSVLLDAVRKEFYTTGDISVPKESKFDIPEFGMALLDAINVGTGEISFPLTHFLGSFDYQAVTSSSGRVEFQIDNRTDLASGTHIPPRYPPYDERENPYSLEQFIQEHPEMENEGVLDVLMDHTEIVSILEPRTRQETGFFMGGGNMYQTFKWSEQHLDCGLQKLPWPIYLLFLDIR